MNAALSFLGLAKRAGRLVIGEESVKLEARANKTKLILTASDAGDSLKKRADNFARMAKCAHTTLPFSKDELGM
ncbi:MAG: 50S ribosomal protein L7, partial [Oscillospiraceae bacterium]|nr:50S ribosomal protein L7 [Oscillospiraceae bacterium]